MLFDKVEREHILQGIKDFEENGYPNGFGPSSTYDLVHERKTYPPKAIMAYANFHAASRAIERYFKGGDNTECFKVLREQGFKVLPKEQNLALVNVKQEFAQWLLQNAPDSYKKMFLGYSLDSIIEKLTEIDDYIDGIQLYLIDKNNIDETINSIKKKISRKGRAENPEFENYDAAKGSGIPKAVIGKKNYFKFLRESFGNNPTINYWIFQGSPDIYNITNALNGGHLHSWKVAAHKAKINIGDKVIIWQTGKSAGCYALAEVTSQVGKFVEESFELQHYINPPSSEETERVQLKIVKYLTDKPILWSQLKDLPEFSDFKAGNQGTNFTATDKQYNMLIKMADENLFTWVETHKQLTQFLLDKENQQEELINLLESAGATLFNDQNPRGSVLKLEEIDPFTFYCYINKYGSETRLAILQHIARELDISVPTDEKGIPSTNAQKVWLFPYKFNRNNNEIKRLWNFFYAVTSNSLTDDLFNDVLSIRNVARIKLTEALFYVDPENYFPINGPTKPYLEEVLKINPNFTTYSEYKSILELIKSKSDKPFYQLSYEAWQWNKSVSTRVPELKNEGMKDSIALNNILFGPPGTGKTYNTINEALKIIDPIFYEENKENRITLNNRFKELLIKKGNETRGQIAFCTFHQSFSYEDFVEGIKPETKDNKVTYDIQNGIFKNICQLADSNLSALKLRKEDKISWDESEFKRSSFYKLSLGDSQKHEDREIYEFCRDNDLIAIGFGDDKDFTGLNESEIKEWFDDEGYKDSNAQMINYFIHYLKSGNFVLISNGNQYIRALGKVTGEYEYNPNASIRYNHFRKVEWIFTDENIPVEEIYNVGLSQRTIYKIDENKLKQDFFVKQGQSSNDQDEKEKKYVLIIDEINRGNVSSIFGELITLIEPDKRAGKPEELEVILPYSKVPFKVPHNIHIIGTMNTADKSIEALDTALRRRFSFTEMPPKPKLIRTEGSSGEVDGIVEGIDLNLLLTTINNRIEKLIDKDHKIGHSYFLKVNSKASLVHCFENEVIPLLEEYFFGDYGKIGLVLGDSFIEKKGNDFEFADFQGYDNDISEDLKERSVFTIKDTKDWDFNSI